MSILVLVRTIRVLANVVPFVCLAFRLLLLRLFFRLFSLAL